MSALPTNVKLNRYATGLVENTQRTFDHRRIMLLHAWSFSGLLHMLDQLLNVIGCDDHARIDHSHIRRISTENIVWRRVLQSATVQGRVDICSRTSPGLEFSNVKELVIRKA